MKRKMMDRIAITVPLLGSVTRFACAESGIWEYLGFVALSSRSWVGGDVQKHDALEMTLENMAC